MKYGFITFWDEDEKPLRITQQEYNAIMKVWDKTDHLMIKGDLIHKKSIKRIRKPEDLIPLELPAPQDPPISKEILEKFKKDIAKKYSFN